MFKFHEIIKKVPSRNYGIDGLEVHVDHTSTGTVYFVSAEKEVVFPEHSHAAQCDYKSFDILKEYYLDEENDMHWTEQQLALIECIGKQNWFAAQV